MRVVDGSRPRVVAYRCRCYRGVYVVRYLSAALAVFLAFSSVPGSVELVANAAAAIAADARDAGATESADVDTSVHEHETPRSREGGCSGTQHVCGCHHSVSFVSAAGTFIAAKPLAETASAAPEPTDSPPFGVVAQIFRPPIRG